MRLAAFAVTLIAAASGAAPERASVDQAADRAALEANARAPGVVTLPGLQYQVLASGPASGARPTRADEVTVRYEGRFLDGRVFNTSPEGGRGVTTFPLQRLIPGWIAALQMMRPGDTWRLWLPPHLAYGASGKDYIPPHSTLVFTVELVGASPAGVGPAPTDANRKP